MGEYNSISFIVFVYASVTFMSVLRRVILCEFMVETQYFRIYVQIWCSVDLHVYNLDLK